VNIQVLHTKCHDHYLILMLIYIKIHYPADLRNSRKSARTNYQWFHSCSKNHEKAYNHNNMWRVEN